MSSMYVFTRKSGSPICYVLLTVQNKHASAGPLIHRQQSIYWIFTQTKLSSIYRHKLYRRLLGLVKHQALLTIQGKLKLAIIFFLLFGRDRLASVWQEEGNFGVLKRSYIQIYPTSVLLCFGKAVNLQHM